MGTETKQIGQSKKYQFNDLRVYKHFPRCKFNDFFMTMVSLTCQQICAEHNSKAKHLVAVMPVNMRFPPKNLDEV